MKRSVSNRQRVWFSVSGALAAGLLALMPAAVAQAQPAPTATPNVVEAPATPPPPPPRPAHPIPPPPRALTAAPAAPAHGYPPPPPRGYPPPPPRYQGYPQQGYPQQGYPQPGYYPPSGYPQPYPQQGYVNQGRAPYGYYMPPPELRGAVYRPFSFTFSVGPGALVGPGEHELAITYNLFRLGFGIAPNLSLVLGYEGAGTNSVNPDSGLDSWLKQETLLFGLQYHFGRGFYVRGAVGEGSVTETTDFAHYSGGSGLALSGALGYEFYQSQHVALALDLNASNTRYARESWQTAGLNLALSFF